MKYDELCAKKVSRDEYLIKVFVIASVDEVYELLAQINNDR